MVRDLKPTLRSAPNRQVFARRTERRVLDYIRANCVLADRESILVAVSGGPDSTALLAILHRLAATLRIGLTLAHFDHRLRGKSEAAGDLEYVKSLASRFGLTLVRGGADVRSSANKRGQSIEDAARSLRYAFLAREARRTGASVVATGHTLSDQAETLLLHIARGSGADGLAGMRPRSKWPIGRGPYLARPLLCLTRREIEHYCNDLGLDPRNDDTNQQLTATRNRIRLRVLPELQAVNPRIAEALARLASTSARDADYLDDVARGTLAALATSDRHHLTLRRDGLRALAPAISTRVIRAAIERVAGSGADIEMTHVEAILALVLVDKRPVRLSLPGTVTVQSDSTSIHFLECPPATQARVPEANIAVPGTTTAGAWTIHCELVARPATFAPRTPLEAYLSPRLTATKLLLRSRRNGDHLRPLGLGGEKKLQDILVDSKIPVRERDRVPLICDETGILWVAGHCLDERARVLESDRQALRITVEIKS